MGFQNPAITGRAIIGALDPEVASARHLEASGEQAALDEADLQEVERAEYYGAAPTAPTAPDSAEPAPRGSILRRLRRR